VQTVNGAHIAFCVALFAEFASYDVEGQTVRCTQVRSVLDVGAIASYWLSLHAVCVVHTRLAVSDNAVDA
jgi:hypothetical protein